jgi:hypothetical protein
MGRITIMFLIISTVSNCHKTMEKRAVHIFNPDGKRIDFEVISTKDRQFLLQNEVKELFRIDTLLFSMPIHILKDGSYLVGYTISDYAFRFKTIENLNLFTDNKDYFSASVTIENNKPCYNFWIKSNDKIIELLTKVNVEVVGYPNKSPMLHYKLYMLQDGTYLRVEKRAENVYSAHWYPDLETFDYLYKNGFAS